MRMNRDRYSTPILMAGNIPIERKVKWTHEK